MSDGFVKIYGQKLLRSTLWMESMEARLLFIGLLAEADADGVVDIPSVKSLAHRMNMTVEQTIAGLAVLEAPDPESRTPDQDGRRVLRKQGHWQVVNYQGYREYRSERQERERERKAAVRDATKDGKSYVYFATDESGLVKIGFSQNPMQRVAQMHLDKTVAAVGRCTMLFAIEGVQADERHYHSLFDAHRVRGEWFRLEGELLAFVSDRVRSVSAVSGPCPPCPTVAPQISEIRDQRSEAEETHEARVGVHEFEPAEPERPEPSAPPEREPGEPEGEDADRMRPTELVRRRYAVRFHEAHGLIATWPPKAVQAAARLGAWLDEGCRDARELELRLAKLLDGFFADSWAASNCHPIAALAANPARYFAPAKIARDVRKGVLAPAPASAFRGLAQRPLEEIFGGGSKL